MAAGFVLATFAAGPCALAQVGPAAGAPAPADAAGSRQDVETRRKWEPVVQFYGEEESGTFSLRVLDRDAKEEAQLVFKEVWTFDIHKKQWVKMDAPRRETKIVPADRKPADGPVDSQVVANLPIGTKDVGLFYAKWEVNGVACVTYMRLGPRSRERSVPGKPPPKYRLEDVPIDANRSVLGFIPDPRFFTDPGVTATSGPAATGPVK